MPRKIRQLVADLRAAGFIQEPARGSHRKFRHAKGQTVILSGHNEGADAHHYQERLVRKAIEDSKK